MPFQGSKPFVSHWRAKFRRRSSHSNVASLCFVSNRACHGICTSRFKCCACNEICSSSAQSAAPATSPATEGAQRAAPATKSAVPVRKPPLLPQNLPLEELKVLCLPQNLHFQCAKRRSCPNLLLKALKVLRLPRNLHIQIHIAQRCQGGSQWQAQLFVKGYFVLILINFLFDGI